jgi:exopolyphosphatase/pppGpp-phosphohydrolase
MVRNAVRGIERDLAGREVPSSGAGFADDCVSVGAIGVRGAALVLLAWFLVGRGPSLTRSNRMSDVLKSSFVSAAVLLCVLSGVEPARASIHGGIEIGGKGIKATAVDVTPGPDGSEVKILMEVTQSHTLPAGLAASGRFDPQTLKEVAAAVAKFADKMQKDHKVPKDSIYVVGSSGLFSAVEKNKEAVENNRKALTEAVQTASGQMMTFIDVQREAELLIAGVIPVKHLDAALLLDIGGGNTKGGFRKEDKTYITFGIPYGSVTLADLIAKRADKEPFAEVAETVRVRTLTPELRKALEGKPGFSNRERIYLSGGAVWALVSFVRPSDRGSYVAVSNADIDAYEKMLLKTPGSYPVPDLSLIGDAAVREAAQKEIEQVKKVYKPEQLLAGAEILKALAEEFDFSKDKKVRFSRHAYLGWILAYIKEKGG